MVKEIIWVHDKGLNKGCETFNNLHEQARAVFVWDDAYFKSRSYSFKRLVFIYETLCQLPVDIVRGSTLDVIKSLAPDKIKTFPTADSEIRQIITQLCEICDVEVVDAAPFVQVAADYEFKRFFKYWNKAQKTAFSRNGKNDA